MENKTQSLENTTHKDDLINFFENFIKTGIVVKEKEITPGFSVKLKVLNTEELLIAESVLLNASGRIPYETLQKVRGASILSQSILNLNGMAVEREDVSNEENAERRHLLYKQLLKMPSLIIQKTYEFYIEAYEEQNKIYSDSNGLVEKVENF
jgi:hypothetical protein